LHNQSLQFVADNFAVELHEPTRAIFGMHRPIMILALTGMSFLSGWATAQSSETRPSANLVIDAERNFAAEAAATGWVEAFLANSAPDGVMSGRQIRSTADALAALPKGDKSLFWWPVHAGIAISGDLGFTTGPFSVAPDRRPVGMYFTVWKRQADASWRWIYDGGVGPVLDLPDDELSDSPVSVLKIADGGVGTSAAAVAQVQAIESELVDAASLVDYLAEDAHVYRRNRIRGQGGTRAIENLSYPASAMHYGIYRIEASAAGDLVFTLGTAHWSAAATERDGYFARIWQYRDNHWRIVYDQIVELPPASGRNE
jgi:hypothetical protein